MVREIRRRSFITWVTETSDDGLFRVEKGNPIIGLGDKSWKVFSLLREYVWALVDSDMKCKNFWNVVVVEEELARKHVIVSIETSCLEITNGNDLGAKRVTVKTLMKMLLFLFDSRVERFAADQNMSSYETYLPMVNSSLYEMIFYEDLHLGTFLFFSHPVFYDETEFFHLCLKVHEIYQGSIGEYEEEVCMDGIFTNPDDLAILLPTSASKLIKKFLMEARAPSEDIPNKTSVCLPNPMVSPSQINSYSDPKDEEKFEEVLKILREKLPDVLGKVHYELAVKLVRDKFPDILGKAYGPGLL